MGRRVTAVVATALTGLLIAHAGRAVYLDVFRAPSPSPGARCGAEIARLHTVFTNTWAARQRGEPGPIDPQTETDFLALRQRCAQEGEAASEAYFYFSRWRHRAESLTRLWGDALHDDAERALGFAQPSRPSP
ncbi:MAG: hypothetical protein JNK72_25185 [Myxococcales bacterium]|nr:hypothetical protein [Myxococcales bacterium]